MKRYVENPLVCAWKIGHSYLLLCENN